MTTKNNNKLINKEPFILNTGNEDINQGDLDVELEFLKNYNERNLYNYH